jgi:hypothetical protein
VVSVDLLCLDELGYMELELPSAGLLFQLLTFTDPRLCAAYSTTPRSLASSPKLTRPAVNRRLCRLPALDRSQGSGLAKTGNHVRPYLGPGQDAAAAIASTYSLVCH